MNYPSIWYNQVLFQKKNKFITNGLTIPYLIGTYEVLNQTLENSIESLINEIVESNFDMCAVLQKCPEIGHYVVGIDNRQFCEKYMKNCFRFENSKGNTSLYVTLNADDLGDKIETIITKLESLYSKWIEKGDFSWNKTLIKWEQFENSEIHKITKVQ